MKKLLLVVIVILSTQYGFSQSFTGSTSGTITISSLQNLSVTTGSSIATTISGTSGLASGTILTNCTTFAIKSNILWLLEFNATSSYFTPSGSGSTTMPCSIIGLRVNGGSTFTYASTSVQSLKTGNRGNTSLSGNTFNIDMYLNPGFSYKGDVYTISILYTLTHP